MPRAANNQRPLPKFNRVKKEKELPSEHAMTVEDLAKELDRLLEGCSLLTSRVENIKWRLGSYGVVARQPSTVTHFAPDDIPF
jgi:hypothetical protein